MRILCSINLHQHACDRFRLHMIIVHTRRWAIDAYCYIIHSLPFSHLHNHYALPCATHAQVCVVRTSQTQGCVRITQEPHASSTQGMDLFSCTSYQKRVTHSQVYHSIDTQQKSRRNLDIQILIVWVCPSHIYLLLSLYVACVVSYWNVCCGWCCLHGVFCGFVWL